MAWCSICVLIHTTVAVLCLVKHAALSGTCGENIHANNGIIHSPGYPYAYDPDLVCVWNISVEEGEGIALRFDSFQLEKTKGCTHDFMEIFEVHSDRTKSIGKFCGTDLQRKQFTSSQNEMMVKFQTDSEAEDKGFAATFNTVGLGSAEENPFSTKFGLGSAEENPFSTKFGLGSAEENPFSTKFGLGSAEENPFSTKFGRGSEEGNPFSTKIGLGSAEGNPFSTKFGRGSAEENPFSTKGISMGTILRGMMKDMSTVMKEMQELGSQGRIASEGEGIFSEGKGSSTTTIFLALGVLLGIILLVSFFLIRKVLKKKRRPERQQHDSEIAEYDPELPLLEQAKNLPYDERWEFPKTRLKFGKTLGEGAFGKVVKAIAIGLFKDSVSTIVAVKMVRDKSSETQRKALMTELKILIHLGQHINIVNLLGAVTRTSKRWMIIVEYCRFGNLRQYLLENRTKFVSRDGKRPKKRVRVKKHRHRHFSLPESSSSSTSSENARIIPKVKITRKGSVAQKPKPGGFSSESSGTDASEIFRRMKDASSITTADLICFAYQCASGMEYLASKRVIHRDLAARNTLLADNKVVKICDFGLTKDLYEYPGYVKKENICLPIKWMAIESIGDKVYTTKSDVWSFGVLLWEFFALGVDPYSGIETKNLYEMLKNGYRMKKPKYSPDEIYEIMKKCWQEDPVERPNFRILKNSLGDLLNEEVKEHYLQLNETYVQNIQRITECSVVNMTEGDKTLGSNDLNCDVSCKPEDGKEAQVLKSLPDDTESKGKTEMMPSTQRGITEDTQLPAPVSSVVNTTEGDKTLGSNDLNCDVSCNPEDGKAAQVLRSLPDDTESKGKTEVMPLTQRGITEDTQLPTPGCSRDTPDESYL